ncbi:hypothetical protein C8F01DRAFT_1156699 [Mycena amicta]|nr:hypothetical protein C8F01DRAFT_1156699 [Mycena amicta]
MATYPPHPPFGRQDDTTYLSLARFNNTLDFDFPLDGTTHRATVSYAYTYAPPEASWPVLIFFNGLGGHRLIAALIEGIAREHGVQVLTLDKHGAGGSTIDSPTSTPPPTRRPDPIHAPGPFVPPSISGSTTLRIASMLPAPFPNALGTILQAAPALGAVISWSGGILSASAGLLSGAGATKDTDEAAAAANDHGGFLERHVSTAVRTETMRRGLSESRVSMGQEALFTLHGGEPAPQDGDGDGCVWGIGSGSTDADVFQGAFERIAGRYLHPNCPLGTQLSVNVVYGAADGMVPKQGRDWLKRLLEATGLIGEADKRAWVEVPEAGHDDILFLEEVVSGILRRVVG